MENRWRFLKKFKIGWAYWCISVIPKLGRWRQEDQKYKASLGYIAKSSQKQSKKGREEERKRREERGRRKKK
jgi:hypothetical protein